METAALQPPLQSSQPHMQGSSSQSEGTLGHVDLNHGFVSTQQLGFAEGVGNSSVHSSVGVSRPAASPHTQEDAPLTPELQHLKQQWEQKQALAEAYARPFPIQCVVDEQDVLEVGILLLVHFKDVERGVNFSLSKLQRQSQNCIVRVCVCARMCSLYCNPGLSINCPTIIQAVTEATGVPVTAMDHNSAHQLLDLEQALSKVSESDN